MRVVVAEEWTGGVEFGEGGLKVIDFNYCLVFIEDLLFIGGCVRRVDQV